MKKVISRMPPFDPEKKCLNAIVETPKASQVKYSYDPDTGAFRLSKALPSGMAFPFNFGFIPGTVGEDGDPLDILIINEEALVVGCWLKVHPIAVMKARQTEGTGKKSIRNDRIIGQAIGKETPPEMETQDLSKKMVSQIEFFFTAYNKLYGKKFKVLGMGGPNETRKLVKAAAKSYKSKKKA